MKKKYQRLPDAELDIMLVLWNGRAEMTRSDIEGVIEKKLAPTTILSLLSRLEKRGVVKVKKDGQRNLYSPVMSQEEYQMQESSSVLEKLYNNSLKDFVAALYNGKSIKQAEIAELEKFIKDIEGE